MNEKTCAIIKPDAVKDKKIGDIVNIIVENDMMIVDMFLICLNKRQASEFYSEHEGRPYFEKLIEFTTSGMMAVMTLEGKNVVQRWRHLMGNTFPEKASPETVRALFGKGVPNNAVHGSDSAASALREISLMQAFKQTFKSGVML